MQYHQRQYRRPDGFTLIELLVVIGIIVVLASLSVPALRSLTKSNDQSQATNLIRSMIGNARTIAISQHRMAGVAFFEESAANSSPANPNQTAMQIFVEDFDQNLPKYAPAQGVAYFVYYSTQRQYLPAGVKVATLNDTNGANQSISTSESADNAHKTRAILFDANGQLLLRSGLGTENPSGLAGTYPRAYGAWNFVAVSGSLVTQAYSSPGLFVYNKSEYDARNFGSETARAQWLVQNATCVVINGYTGGILH